MSSSSFWDNISDAYCKGGDLERAVFDLVKYYSQSKTGRKAKALVDKLHGVFWNEKHASWARSLAAFETTHVATPEEAAYRKRVWVVKLRPVLTDETFLESLTETRVNLKNDIDVTLEERDACIQILRDAVPYWDAHFSLKVE